MHPLIRSHFAASLFLLVSTLAPAAEFHVTPVGNDANAGTPSAMLRTITEAANRAQPGDTVTVHEGVYRERVNPPRGGTGENARITYQAAPGESVTIKGSEPVSGWEYVGGDTWMVILPNSYFGSFNPYNHLLVGDWFRDKGRSHHAGAVYLNGDWLAEAASKTAALQPASGTPLWFAEVDGGGSLLNVAWLQPHVGTTAGTKVDASFFDQDFGTMVTDYSEAGECVGWIDAGDWTRYDTVDFGENADQLKIRASSGSVGGTIEVRLDGPDGPLLGSVTVPNTGGWQTWQTFDVSILATSGVHKVCLVYRSAVYSAGNTTIWAQFPGKNPNSEMVEINARQTVFYPEITGMNYITVRGFTLEQAAPAWGTSTGEQMAIIGTHWSKGWIIENNIIRYSICSGIALGKYGDRWENTAQTLTPGGIGSSIAYMNMVVRAINDRGWNKETIGSHIVRGNHISHCEQSGVVGSMGGAFSRIENNHIHDIHVRQLYTGDEMSGIKLHGAIDTQIIHNHIHHTVRGLWLDWMAQGTRVSGNLFHDNHTTQDMFLEVDHGPVFIDHNFFLSPYSIWDGSEGETYAHNLIAGRVYFDPDQIRRDVPYHLPHSTTIAGYARITGGDTRFYNNILVGPASLAGYNSAVFPVAMDGNVFLKGATASTHETSALVLSAFDPAIQLRAGTGGYYLEMNADPAWGTARNRPVVITSLLGNAVVPAMPFEQPDGTPYLLNADYLGNARAASPFPGPFEQVVAGANLWKVSTATKNPGPVAVTGPQRVHVDINGGQTTGTAGDFSGTPATTLGAAGETWNTVTPGNKTSGTASGLRNAANETTTLNLAWTPNHWSYDNSTAADAYRDLLGDYAYIYKAGQASSTWTFGGLGANAICNLVIYTSTGSAGGKWTVNGETKEATASTQANSLTEGENFVRFDNLRASSSGEIAISFGIRVGAQYGEMSALEIETSGTTEAPPVSVIQTGFNGGSFEVSATGLDPARRYVLTRSADLRDGFPVVIGSAVTPAAEEPVTVLADTSPPSLRAFYRIEELP